mmetsp:Transcript_127048/g.367788  ORF Transcript_127048/g.367788 Transcript_127048/m.367788 type:complete len:200 (+) Transcript_127048:414-1013(+)
MRLLRLIRRRHLACADGPHGLVGDDDLVPILHLRQDGRDLALVHLVGLPGLPLIKLLTDAEDDLHALLLALLHLLRRDLVGLAILGAALRVPDQRPRHAEVHQVLGGVLACERTEAGRAHVLGGDLHAHALQTRLHHGQVQRRGADHHLDLLLVERLALPPIQQLLGVLHRRRVALPIAANNRGARHLARRTDGMRCGT